MSNQHGSLINIEAMAERGRGPTDPYEVAGDPLYDASFCDLIVNLARDMQFPEEWAAYLGVTENRMMLWTRQFPAFADAFALAMTILRAKWTAEVRKAARGKVAFAMSPLFLMIAKKRFPDLWGDAADQKKPPDNPLRDVTPQDASQAIIDSDRPVSDMKTQELEAELARLMGRHGAR